MFKNINEDHNLNNNNNNNLYSLQLHSKYDKYMLLRISVSKNISNYNTVLGKYIQSAANHNNNMLNNLYPDAGFNIFTTDKIVCSVGSSTKIDFGIKCSATIQCDTNKSYPSGFYMYPRSSTGSKTGLRLANSVGIIDSGYRGHLIGMFDNVKEEYTISELTSIVQICGPSLVPIWIEIVDELEGDTERGDGGFGSTGK